MVISFYKGDYDHDIKPKYTKPLIWNDRNVDVCFPNFIYFTHNQLNPAIWWYALFSSLQNDVQVIKKKIEQFVLV